jgi:hypothetical protein
MAQTNHSAKNAVDNAIRNGRQLERIERNVREDVRSGDLHPRVGAAIIEHHRKRRGK